MIYGGKKSTKIYDGNSSTGRALERKIGRDSKKCTIKGVHSDMFLYINGIRTIESLQVNKGAIVITSTGKKGSIYFGSYTVYNKIRVYAGKKIWYERPTDLTIISFF